MTAEKLHDALNLLPGDLVAATDALRCQPRKVKIHWARWATLAACAAVVIFCGWYFRAGFGKSASTADMAMQAESYEFGKAAPAEPNAAVSGASGDIAPEAAEESAADRERNIPAATESSETASTTCMAAVWKNQCTTRWRSLSASLEDSPRMQLLRSVQELVAYVEENQDYYAFDADFRDSLAIYDEAWFEENDLLVVVMEPYTTVNDLLLTRSVIPGEYGNVWELLLSGCLEDVDAEGCWHVLMDLRKGVIKEDDTILAVIE